MLLDKRIDWFKLLKMRILFLRFGSIGNAMVAVPAIRAVRKEMPDAFLALLCNPETYDLWKDCPWLDQALTYDQKGRQKSLTGYFKMIAELRKHNFTHSVHFRRLLRSELIGFLSGAKTRIGFDPGGFSLLTKKVPYREDQPIVEQNLELVRQLGILAQDSRLEYWAPEPSEKLKSFFKDPSRLKVVISPFARTWREKRWRRYPELAQSLIKKMNAEVVVAGARDELELARQEFRGIVPEDNFAFGLPIRELAGLFKLADLFIGQDAGPVHLAVAVNVASIIIYSPAPDRNTIFEKWKPAGDKFLAVLPPQDCRTCAQNPCSQGQLLECLERIGVEDVLKRVSELNLRGG